MQKDGDIQMRKIFRFTCVYIKKYKIAILLLVILISFSTVTSLALPYISSCFIDFLTAIKVMDNSFNKLIQYCLCFAGIGLLSVLIGFLSNRLYTYLATKIEYEMNKSIIYHIHNLDFSFSQNQDYARLSQQINTDVNSLVVFFFDILQNSLTNILKFLVSMYLLYKINRQILFLLLVVLLVYVLVYVSIKPKLYKSIYKVREAQVDFYSETYKQLHFFKFIKAQGLTRVFLNNLIMPFEKLLTTIMKSQTIQYFFNGLDSIVVSFAQIGIFIIGGVSIMKGYLSVGQFTLLSSYFAMYIVGIRYFLGLGKTLQVAKVSYQRIINIMDEPCSSNGEHVIETISKIEMNSVSFSYGGKDVLKEFDCKFEHGKCYGITGENGSGKTTLSYILMGLLRCDAGTVTYNGIDITELDMNLMREKKISYSEQEPVVLGDSPLNANLFPVKMLESSMLDKDVFPDLYKELLNIFNLNKFFEIDTSNEINRFHNLSGGEKQKIAIVRTLLKGASLLIFDEPTSMMDQESIDLFCSVIKRIKDKKIIIIISHDGRLLCCYDKIIKL